jgi:lysine 2,3-aminomutase
MRPSLPATRPEGWTDWTWQMRQRVRDAESLRAWLEPTPDEEAGIEQLAAHFHFVITPYYASLMDPADPDCPIRRQVVPHIAEAGDLAGLAERALLPLLPAQAHGGRARLGDEEA